MQKSKVFISHTTRDPRDSDLSRKLAKRLRQEGHEVWIAPESIPLGRPWASEIIHAIGQTCSHFIVVLSPASAASDHVRKEATLALERARFDPGFKILPIKIGEIQSSHWARQINRFQGVVFDSDEKKIIAQVLKSLYDIDNSLATGEFGFEELLDPWKFALRPILEDTVREQLASRQPWRKSVQKDVFKSITANNFLKKISRTKNWAPASLPILSARNATFNPAIYELELIQWSEIVSVYSAPATMAVAAVGIYLRDYLNLPLHLNFEFPHGVAIVESINKGAVEPDAFFAGDSQIAWLSRPYRWGLAFGTVRNRTMAPVDGSSATSDASGTLLVTEGSTLELAYENYVANGQIDRRRITKKFVEPAEALATILLNERDPSQRAMLWPPNWRIAEISGLARAVDTLSQNSWNATLYFSTPFLLRNHRLADAVCAAYLLGWYRLASDAALRDSVITALANDTSYSESMRSASGYDYVAAPTVAAVLRRARDRSAPDETREPVQPAA